MNAAQVASRQIRRIKYDVPEKPRSEPGSPRGEAEISSGSMNIIHCGSERMSCAGEVFLAILRRAGDTGVVAIEAPCEAAP